MSKSDLYRPWGGKFANRELDKEGDKEPWYVAERKPAAQHQQEMFQRFLARWEPTGKPQ